jgi:hypothetical protein
MRTSSDPVADPGNEARRLLQKWTLLSQTHMPGGGGGCSCGAGFGLVRLADFENEILAFVKSSALATSDRDAFELLAHLSPNEGIPDLLVRLGSVHDHPASHAACRILVSLSRSIDSFDQLHGG